MSPVSASPVVVTVLVNWKGCDDTIECLESLFNSDYPSQRVVVVDNGSNDGSLAKLEAWAAGSDRLAQVRGRPVQSATLSLDDESMGRGWGCGADLFLIDAKLNYGFAGGVNIGIRFALLNSSARYVWVLNNDTVVARDCLSKMEERMRHSEAAGMCGSRILFYWQPETVQVMGGARFRPWTGTSRLIGSRTPASATAHVDDVERALDHLSGASMLVSREFLEDVGLMDETLLPLLRGDRLGHARQGTLSPRIRG